MRSRHEASQKGVREISEIKSEMERDRKQKKITRMLFEYYRLNNIVLIE